MLSRVRALAAYGVLLAGVLLFIPEFAVAGALTVLAVVAMSWRELQPVPKAVLTAALATAVAALWHDPAPLTTAAANTTRLTGMILSVMLLSSLLGQSRDLKTVSISLFGGNPTARYLSLTFGTNILSIPLNVGAVPVVGGLVRDRIQRQGDSSATRNGVRAILRGFGTAPMYSPLSISVALTLTLVPHLEITTLMAISAPFALLTMLAGLRWRDPEQNVTGDGPAPEAVGAWCRFLALILILSLAVMSGHRWLGWDYARAVLLTCLATAALGVATARLAGRKPALPDLSQGNNEMAIIGGSALIGAVLGAQATTILTDAGPHLIDLWPILAAAVPWLLFLGGLVGISPILTGTLAGSILGPVWPASATLALGLAMVIGWGVTAFGTPFGINALIMARLSGYPARRASFLWNLPLSLTVLVLASILVASLCLFLL